MRRLLVVPGDALRRVADIVRGAVGSTATLADPALAMTTQNVLANWGAGRAAAAASPCAPPVVSTTLSPNWLSPYAWTLVDQLGEIQQSDSKSITDLLCTRLSTAYAEEGLHPDATSALPARLNTRGIWLVVSIRALRKPRGRARQDPETADSSASLATCWQPGPARRGPHQASVSDDIQQHPVQQGGR